MKFWNGDITYRDGFCNIILSVYKNPIPDNTEIIKIVIKNKKLSPFASRLENLKQIQRNKEQK